MVISAIAALVYVSVGLACLASPTFRQTLAIWNESESADIPRLKLALCFAVLLLVQLALWPLAIAEIWKEQQTSRIKRRNVCQRRRHPDAEWFESSSDVVRNLCTLWDGVPRARSRVLYRIIERKGRPARESIVWTIGILPSFRKSVAALDKKLQGRVLEALTEISENPLGTRGDTVKPLEAGLKGLWRYRIGDYRLIYRPDPSAHLIVLIDFQARAEAYA